MAASPSSTMPSQSPSPRGWNKPVRPLALVLVVCGLLLAWLMIMAAGVWYFYSHWQAQLTMAEQPVRLRLPKGTMAVAEIDTPLQTRLNVQPTVKLPLKQTLTAQLPDQLQAHVKIDTTLPVDTSITIEHSLPVQTTLEMAVKLRSWLPAVAVSVPVSLVLPLRLTVPVKVDVPVKLDIDASANLPPTIDISVDQVFTLKPQIAAALQARVVSQMAFSLIAPVEPFDLRIAHADLSVPFNLTFLRQRQAR